MRKWSLVAVAHAVALLHGCRDRGHANFTSCDIVTGMTYIESVEFRVRDDGITGYDMDLIAAIIEETDANGVLCTFGFATSPRRMGIVKDQVEAAIEIGTDEHVLVCLDRDDYQSIPGLGAKEVLVEFFW